MKKRSFILIGISLLIQLTGITIPFFGVNSKGFETSSISLSLLCSFILLMIALKGIYKDTKNESFYKGYVMSIVAICVFVCGTIIAPIIAGESFCGPFEYILKVLNLEYLETSQNTEYLAYTLVIFLNSFKAIFIISTISVIFYTISIFNFLKGLKSVSIETLHENKLNKTLKKFMILNILLYAAAVIVIVFFAGMFSVLIHEYPTDSEVISLILYFIGLYVLVLPGTVVLSVFFYINLIKSVILIFKTPGKFIEESVN